MDSIIGNFTEKGRRKGVIDKFKSSGEIEETIIDDLSLVIASFCRDISHCTSEVLINTSYWDKSSNAVALLNLTFDALDRSRDSPLRVYIIVDTGNALHGLGKKSVRITNVLQTLGLRAHHWKNIVVSARSVHHTLFGTIHSKFNVYDRKSMVLCSNNIQDRPNLEMAVKFRGEVVDDFVQFFWTTWGKPRILGESNDNNSGGVSDTLNLVHAHRAPSGGVCRRVECPQNEAWAWMFNRAKSHVTCVSPTFNARDAKDLVISTISRGVRVDLLLTLGFNDAKESLPFQGGTNLSVARSLWEKARVLGKSEYLRVYWYTKREIGKPKKAVHSHIKYMSIDGEIAIFGNGNMDSQSWYHSQEANLIVFSPDVVRSWDSSIQTHFGLQEGGHGLQFVYPHWTELLPPEKGMERIAY